MTVTSSCNRCDGSGVYRGTRRDGTTYEGACFACQGGGPRFVRRRSYSAARPALPEAARIVMQAPWSPRAQAHLDAFAVAQPAAHAWLMANEATNDFARSLLSGCARYGGLTPRQLAAVERNLDRPAIATPTVATAVTRDTASLPSDSEIGFMDPLPAAADIRAVDPEGDARNAAVAVAPVLVGLDRVRQAMESARASGLRKVRLDFGDVSMRLSGPTFRSGAGLILCYFRGAYCGHVDTANVWRARYGAQVSADALAAFRRVGADPQAAARTHGQDTSHCSCCRRRLTDPVSVMANIGPVCARRFGWSF